MTGGGTTGGLTGAAAPMAEPAGRGLMAAPRAA